MMRRPPRSTLSSSSAASDVYKRQDQSELAALIGLDDDPIGYKEVEIEISSHSSGPFSSDIKQRVEVYDCLLYTSPSPRDS